jgi:copper chaperone
METLKFKTSLKCGGCVSAIKSEMDELKGVAKWEVDLTQPVKILSVEGEHLNESEIIDVLKEAGYEASKL